MNLLLFIGISIILIQYPSFSVNRPKVICKIKNVSMKSIFSVIVKL